MAKLKVPLLSLKAVGSITDFLTFDHRRRTHIVEKKPIPTDARSAAQLPWRHMFQKATALWKTLSAAEKQEWETLARRKRMTGYAWFISQALKPNPGLYLPLQGGSMQGTIDMVTHRILHLPAPIEDEEPARLIDLGAGGTFIGLTDTPASYAGQANKAPLVNPTEDALIFQALAYLLLAGGTMAGDINMATHQVTGLPTPVNTTDAVRKAYADLFTLLTTFNAHKTRHQDAGADELNLALLSGELADRQKSKTGNSTLGWTDEKLLKGAGTGITPEEIDVPTDGYTQGARAYHSAAQSIPNTTNTALTFNSEDDDTDNIHDNVTNNSRLTCKTAGRYIVLGGGYWAGNSTGFRVLGIFRNGSIFEGEVFQPVVGTSGFNMQVVLRLKLELNDYIQLVGYQNSGGALNIGGPELAHKWFAMQRIG